MYGELFFWAGIAIFTIIIVWHIGAECVRYINGDYNGSMLWVVLKGILLTCGLIFLLISNGQRMSTDPVNLQGDDTTKTVTQKRMDEVIKEKVNKRRKDIKVDKEKQKVDEKEAVESMDEFRKNIMKNRGEQ